MKVLYISHCPDLNGSSRALLHLLKGLGKRVEPVVLVPKGGPLQSELQEAGIPTYVYPYSIDIRAPYHSLKDLLLWVPRQIRTYVYRSRVKRYAAKIVTKEKVSIVHTNSSVIHWGADVARACGVPHVWHIRECQDVGLDLCPLKGMSRLIEQMAAPSNHCIAITKFVFQHHDLSANKDRVIYDGVFHRQQLDLPVHSKKGNYFLYVGTLSVSKGFFDALAAFEKIAEDCPSVELWFVGAENQPAADAVRASRYADRIRLLGFRNEVYSLMQSAKAVLVPTHFEGFGFVAVEAMLNECLVIGRDTAGTKEQFDNGVLLTGKEIGLRFKDVDELADRMLWVCRAEESQLREYADRGKRVVEQYTIEKSCDLLFDMYTDLLKS